MRNRDIGNSLLRQGMVSNFNVIKRNGDQLLRLVNQLLDLSKMEDRSFKLQLQHSDVVSFLRYLTRDFEDLAESKNQSLTFISDLASLEMDFDPEQLQMIMTNLISNAIKFTPTGGSIRVEVGCSGSDISYLTIAVSDTGIGIAAEDLPHVFDRFYQVDGTTTRTSEGTGIGLAHSLELVKLMSGQINVESEFGKGTVFNILLPIPKTAAKSVLPEKNKPFSQLPDMEGLQNIFDKKLAESENNNNDMPQLLIIEDNPDLVIYLKSCLEDFYHIKVATNGKIGIDKAVEQIPDLVLSDVMMPEKDDFEVVDFLKNDERTSHIPVALLTAKTDVVSKINGLKRGADAYLSKPFHREELLATLDMMTENTRRLQNHFSRSASSLAKVNIAGGVQEEVAVAEMETAIQMEHVFLQKMRTVLEENYADINFALPQLREELGMNRYQLFRKMKAISDESASNFIRSFRMEKAKLLFETTDMNVSEVAYQVGYKDLAHFSKSFNKTFGITPSEFRKQ